MHAVVLERASARVHVAHCTFVNAKEGIYTRGGGVVQLEYSRFSRNESALNLDDKVTGHAIGNSVDGTMFGRYFRPRGFRCSANECTADSGSDGEADGDA